MVAAARSTRINGIDETNVNDVDLRKRNVSTTSVTRNERDNNLTTDKGISTNNETTAAVVVDGTPHMHTIVFYVTMVCVLLYHVPSIQEIDTIATIQIITHRIFPSILTSMTHLLVIRLMISIIIWYITIQMILSKKGWYIQPPYLPTSKCQRSQPGIHILGIKTLYPFTSWSWIVLGCYFTLASYITYDAIMIEQQHHGSSTTTNDNVQDLYNTYNVNHPYLLRITVLLWEISAPCTVLVAFIIRYVMWPAVLRRGNAKNHTLHSIQNLFMHNGNVLFALIDKCLLSNVPIRYTEWTFAPLYGCVYVAFTWSMMYSWYNNNKNHDPSQRVTGPQFIYFFLDTTIPGYYSSIALLLLLSVLLFFYSIYCCIDPILQYFDNQLINVMEAGASSRNLDEQVVHFLLHCIAILFISSLLMRFRD